MSATDPHNVCVYMGSSSGRQPQYASAAKELGHAIASRGHRLVYGGGHVGLMGVVADAVLEAAGDVIGVMTEHLVELEVQHLGLTELQVFPTMHERKAAMAHLADGVVVLPGGFGTLDETFEILTWNQLGLVSTPVIFLDVDGYFDPLFDFIASSAAEGFVKPTHGELAQRTTDPDLAVHLATRPGASYEPKWVD